MCGAWPYRSRECSQPCDLAWGSFNLGSVRVCHHRTQIERRKESPFSEVVRINHKLTPNRLGSCPTRSFVWVLRPKPELPGQQADTEELSANIFKLPTQSDRLLGGHIRILQLGATVVYPPKTALPRMSPAEARISSVVMPLVLVVSVWGFFGAVVVAPDLTR